MGWGRLDDGLDDHPKFLALLDHEQGGAAIGLWTLCLAYANRVTRKAGKTPGLLPSGLPRRYLGAQGRELATLLVKVGLWEEAPDGWLIHDFGDFLPSDETRAARSEAGRRGAAKRWGGKTEADGGDAPGQNQTDAQQDDGASVASAEQDDGKLPLFDGNLPSESQTGAGKAVANDGSRTRARRDPTPVPEVLPKTPSSGASQRRRDKPNSNDEDNPTAQTIVGEWLERCRKRPAAQVIGQTAKAIRTMLAEGIDADDIRRGVDMWQTKGLHPSALASVVNEVQNATPRTSAAAAAGPPAAQSRPPIPRAEQCHRHPFSRAGDCRPCKSERD